MPHLVLELSGVSLPRCNEVPDFLTRLVRILGEFETIEAKDVKGRAIRYDVAIPLQPWVSTQAVNAGGPLDWAHIEIRLLAGRPPELLSAIADRFHAELVEFFGTEGRLSLTVEVREMARETYRK